MERKVGWVELYTTYTLNVCRGSREKPGVATERIGILFCYFLKQWQRGILFLVAKGGMGNLCVLLMDLNFGEPNCSLQ